MGTVATLEEIKRVRAEARDQGKSVVFTNGCFDVLHRGHVEYLAQASELGDMLIVGVNSDASVRALKGEDRPVVTQEDRAAVLAALGCVDWVVIFDDESVAGLVAEVLPDVLAKGGDYALDGIVGREAVEAAGGRVVAVASSVPQASSSEIIRKMERGSEE